MATTPKPTGQAATTFPKFLDLPTELRLIIIEIYLANNVTKNQIPDTAILSYRQISARIEPPLLNTSLQIRGESLKPYRALLLSISDELDKELDTKKRIFDNTKPARRAPWSEKEARIRLTGEINLIRDQRVMLRKELMLVRIEIEAAKGK